MDRPQPILLFILTGFLGAGKTTLLNKLLKLPSAADTAVVVNEFGEVSIDHLLVEQAADGMIELGGGCLCCTVRGALVDTLLLIAERDKRPRRVIIETTGLAEPVPILQSVIAHPELSRLYRIDCVVTVVDAVNGPSTLDEFEEARSQVAVADRIVMTKADLALEEDRQALLEKLAALNPGAELLDNRRPASLEDLMRSALDRTRLPGSGADHRHDHAAHNHDQFHSITVTHDQPIPLAAVENFLDLLTTQQGDHILRIKGLVETAEHPDRPLLIQGAQKLLHRPERLAGWPRGERGTRIVVIGRGLDTDYIRRIFAAFAGQAAVDTPDRGALEDNPLAIPGLRF
ncbi:GTP-binding protein [Chelativorans sp.]|uniref:CobW family GTP-binding protein n=1 Tax=Chelativorans sp. TaxID=2203393 RepID=UPI002810B780|nr:GTP-binding protein [Chelativorans sp.]